MQELQLAGRGRSHSDSDFHPWGWENDDAIIRNQKMGGRKVEGEALIAELFMVISKLISLPIVSLCSLPLLSALPATSSAVTLKHSPEQSLHSSDSEVALHCLIQ